MRSKHLFFFILNRCIATVGALFGRCATYWLISTQGLYTSANYGNDICLPPLCPPLESLHIHRGALFCCYLSTMADTLAKWFSQVLNLIFLCLRLAVYCQFRVLNPHRLSFYGCRFVSDIL